MTTRGTAFAAGEHLWVGQRTHGTVEWLPNAQCGQLVGTPGGTIWCIEHQPPRVRASEDEGRTWAVAEFETSAFGTGLRGLAEAYGDNGIALVSMNGVMWIATHDAAGNQITFSQFGHPGWGRDCEVDFAFISPARVCIPQCALLACSVNLGASWHWPNSRQMIDGVASGLIWWAFGQDRTLRWTRSGDFEWRTVEGTEDCKFWHLAAGNDGAFGLADCRGEFVLVKLEADGHIGERIPTGNQWIQDINASGGRVAVGSACGVYVLEGRKLVMELPVVPTTDLGGKLVCPTK